MDLIKIMVVATYIMEKIRRQRDEVKDKLRAWMRYVIYNNRADIKKNKLDRYSKIDTQRVKSVTLLKLNQKARDQLMEWYNMTEELNLNEDQSDEQQIMIGYFVKWFDEEIIDTIQYEKFKRERGRGYQGKEKRPEIKPSDLRYLADDELFRSIQFKFRKLNE